MLACERGHTKVVELLLEEGGQEAGIESKNARGETPLMLAVKAKNPSLVQLLVEFDANVNQESFKNETVLFLACQANHLDIIMTLLDNGVVRDAAAFDMMRGETAAIVNQRLAKEAAASLEADDEKNVPVKKQKNPRGQWVLFRDKKPGTNPSSKVQPGKDKFFYYNKVSRIAQRVEPEDYKKNMKHVPRWAIFGLHFYH